MPFHSDYHGKCKRFKVVSGLWEQTSNLADGQSSLIWGLLVLLKLEYCL